MRTGGSLRPSTWRVGAGICWQAGRTCEGRTAALGSGTMDKAASWLPLYRLLWPGGNRVLMVLALSVLVFPLLGVVSLRRPPVGAPTLGPVPWDYSKPRSWGSTFLYRGRHLRDGHCSKAVVGSLGKFVLTVTVSESSGSEAACSWM